MSAKELRLRRLAGPDGTWAMVPLDHGIGMGPIAGFEDPGRALAAAEQGGATCTAVHRGLVARIRPRSMGVLLHLSASTQAAPDPDDKRLVATVEDALRLGCDGVSIHVNVGSATEARQLEDAGRVAGACDAWGMPLVAMMYPRGPSVTNPTDARLVAHAARLGAELGADAVKVPYTGSEASMRTVVAGCPVPVLVAGGPQRSLDDLAADLAAARRAGAAGFSVGRNVAQHVDPTAAVARLVAAFAASDHPSKAAAAVAGKAR